MAQAIKDLKDDLVEVMNGLVDQLESNEAGGKLDNKRFVGGGWFFEPTRFAMDAARYWQTFLVLAHRHESELAAWAPETTVAAGMQALFSRIAMLWQTSGSEVAKEAIKKDVPKFVKSVVKYVEPTKVDAADAAVERTKEAVARAEVKLAEATKEAADAQADALVANSAKGNAANEAAEAKAGLKEKLEELIQAVKKLG